MVTVTFGWTATRARAPTPDGSVVGTVSGRPVCARAAATDGTWLAFAAEVQVRSPKGSCSRPAAGRPSVTSVPPTLAMAEMAWKSFWVTLTGATRVGA